MSLYTDGAMVGAEPPKPTVIVNAGKAQDNFWTVVKWAGAALVLITGYREARQFWREKLGNHDDEEGTEE